MNLRAKKAEALQAEALQKEAFSQTRAQHQLEIAEDYVELISDLLNSKGEARLVDVARRFGVSNATASKTIARLKRDGLVDSEPYRALFLTPQGEALAAQARERHEVVFQFLCRLGLPKEIAARDAEGMEHHCSAETLYVLQQIAMGNWEIIKND